MAWSFVGVARIEPPMLGDRWRALVTLASDSAPDVESHFIEFFAQPTLVQAAAAGQAKADALNAALAQGGG